MTTLFRIYSKIPFYFRWAKDISWYRYGFELLMYNQWRHVTDLQCQSNSAASSSIASGSAANGTVAELKESSMCFKDGNQVLEFYAVDKNAVFQYFGVLTAYNIALRLFGYIALWFRSLGR